MPQLWSDNIPESQQTTQTGSVTNLIRLDFGCNPSVVDDLRRQKVILDVGVGDTRATADETSALQVGCGSVTCRVTMSVGAI